MVFYGSLKLEESFFQRQSIGEDFYRKAEGRDLALYREYYFNAMNYVERGETGCSFCGRAIIP